MYQRQSIKLSKQIRLIAYCTSVGELIGAKIRLLVTAVGDGLFWLQFLGDGDQLKMLLTDSLH